MTPGTIEFVDAELLNFRDHDFTPRGHHGYRWVDLKRFRIVGDAPAATDRELLAALVADPEFADGYFGAGASAEIGAHGPYRVEAVTADSYQACPGASATAEIRRWAGRSVPGSLAAALTDRVYTPIRESTACYRLGELADDLRHDYAGVHIEFREFVLVDRPAARLTVVVAADD